MAGLTTTVTVDGKEVTFRASAEILRMYRFKFRRDVLIDMQRIGQDMQRKKKTGADIPIESLTIFENIAYIMAKHGSKDAVPNSPDEWLDEFSTFSIYELFPVIKALWDRNEEALDIAKKNLAP